MAFHEEYDFGLLVNEKERWIIDEVEKQLEGNDKICHCQECILDMVTLALNQTKPAYRVTLMGAIYAKAENETIKEEINSAVAQAIEKVKKNPSHGSIS